MTTRFAFLPLVCVGGLLLTFYPTVFSGFQRMQPEAGDILLNNLFFEHSYRWAFDSSYPFSFWSPGFFYPTPYALTFSETCVGTAPLYWLFRGLGCSESLACQLWVLATYALNFISMAIVLRWFGVNTLLTAAGAYLFAFGLLRADHLTHQHLMAHYFSPFAVWYAWSFLRAPTARRWAMVVLLCGAQILASLHLGWFLCFGLIIFAVWGLGVEPGSWKRIRTYVRCHWPAIVLPASTVGLLVGLYARNFYHGAPGYRSYWEAAMYCPYIDGWFVATPGSLWADHLTPRDSGLFPEKALFQGFAIYAAMIAGGWYAWRNRTADRGLVLASIGTAIVLALLTTRWGYNLSLWAIVHAIVPGANAFRAIGRIAYAFYLFGTIGGLVGVQSLLQSRIANLHRRTAAFALLSAVMILEQTRPFPEHFDKEQEFFGPAQSLVPALDGVDAAYLMYDESMPYYRHEIAAMWAGLWTKVPFINGFSGTLPPGHPGHGARPSVEEMVGFLGPNWSGKLAVIEWGPPVARTVYQVSPADGQATRIRRIEP